MTLADRKWLQGRLEELTKESPSVVIVVLDLSDRLGESVTMAILAATESMTVDGQVQVILQCSDFQGVVADLKPQRGCLSVLL